jgi:hypothetical protein
MFTTCITSRCSNTKKHLAIPKKTWKHHCPMAIDGKEPIGSMGSDVPLAY